jgi:hypothetical protein
MPHLRLSRRQGGMLSHAGNQALCRPCFSQDGGPRIQLQLHQQALKTRLHGQRVTGCSPGCSWLPLLLLVPASPPSLIWSSERAALQLPLAAGLTPAWPPLADPCAAAPPLPGRPLAAPMFAASSSSSSLPRSTLS